MEKKRAYEQRVREVEHGSFTPLVFSAAGGMGPAADIVYKKLASMLAEKQDKTYSTTLNWMRCRLNFSLIRSEIMFIRGSRKSFTTTTPWKALDTGTIDLATQEGRVLSV